MLDWLRGLSGDDGFRAAELIPIPTWGSSMPKRRLTSSFIGNVECAAGQRKVLYFDEVSPGLLLEVRSSGGKTFYQRYRVPGGTERQVRIGPANILSLQEARHKGKALFAAALLGADKPERPHIPRPVSYTHLTLPTKRIV